MIYTKKPDATVTTLPKAAALSGFTLIELLVVIAIIAILASVLLPVLSRAQARAQQTYSLNNVKELAAAQNMYVDDNNQMFPTTRLIVPTSASWVPAGYDDKQPQWTDLAYIYLAAIQNQPGAAAANNGVWFNALPNYVGSKPLYAYDSTINNGIALYNGGKNIFHCPSVNPNSIAVNQNKYVIFEYGMNSKGDNGNGGGTSIDPVRTSMVKHPSAYVMFSDNRVSLADDPAWDTFSPSQTPPVFGSPENYTTRLSFRHDNGANFSFSDGHAQWFKYGYAVVDVQGKPADPGVSDINWSYDGTAIQ